MNENIELYDLRPLKDTRISQSNHPKNKGNTFRTLQVFECPICGALSNKVEIGRRIFGGLFRGTVCPYSADCWHHELEEKIEQLQRLQKEIKHDREEHAALIQNDIAGQPDFLQKKIITHTKTFRKGRCKHSESKGPGFYFRALD